MREVLAEPVRLVNEHRTRNDEVSNRFARFVKQYKDVNVRRVYTIPIDKKIICFAERFDLHRKCVVNFWVMCEKVNSFCVAKCDRCLKVALQEFGGNEKFVASRSSNSFYQAVIKGMPRDWF